MKQVIFVIAVSLILMGFAPHSQEGSQYLEEVLPNHFKELNQYWSKLYGLTGILIGFLLLVCVWIPSGKKPKR